VGDRGGLDPYESGDDWARYGGARERPVDAEAEELLRDDPFAAYRYENGSASPQDQEPPRRHGRANLLGAVTAVTVIAVVATIANLAAPGPNPAPTPTRTPWADNAPTTSPLMTAPRPTVRLARVVVTVPMPIPVFIPDRAYAFDDGSRMYLAGNAGVLPVDVAAGTVGTVWSGSAFPKGLRRLVYDRGIWVSSWPISYAVCGPPCWDKASTYRIDPESGEVTLSLERTFLIGAQYDGVYVASAGRLRILHPVDGSERFAVAWRTAGEPRLGCGGVWSVELGAGTEVRAINVASGDQVGGSDLPPETTYGPIYSEGLCWMMSGLDGASAGGTRLILLSANGSAVEDRTYTSSMVVLDSEFWRLAGDGSIQRFEVLSGQGGYGRRYILPIGPENGDPGSLFAAVGSMWLYRGQQLIGFDILTGSDNAGS
jgi:hypothetical protein